MQSILQNKTILTFPDLARATGPLTQMRQMRFFLIYGGLYILAAILILTSNQSTAAAFGHSLILPGSGFLAGWTLEDGFLHSTLIWMGLSWLALAAAGFLWFATGNVLAPPLVWIGIAVLSAVSQSLKPKLGFDLHVTLVSFAAGPLLLAGLFLHRSWSLHRGQKQRAKLNQAITQNAAADATNVISLNSRNKKSEPSELSLSELQHMRLLLDRALQPVDQFEGFEWIDQFQTSAVRYQINFISYALSMAQAQYMPAFTGYLSQAQQNLKAKQENHRIWKYWQAENMWGNLRKSADPIARDNIMYSGFVGAQLSLARQADPRNAEQLDGLSCQAKTHDFTYSQDAMMRQLVEQYKTAKYGLLPCEPNWVYPLCNAITATAIQAHDAASGTQYWESISDEFRNALETEFMTPDGRFVPFRSNYIGFAPPQIGGAVMQSFPCFFLNGVLPDIAHRQWDALRHRMTGKSWKRALWPADVGNYNLSRASSYAATALAAREMGDAETADHLMELLSQDCPRQLNDGIAHYSKASIWANANAFMAQINRTNGFRELVTKAPSTELSGPYLAEADPTSVLIAKAASHQGTLHIVAYPAATAGFKSFTLAGLMPDTDYQINGQTASVFKARQDGTQIIHVPVNGRTDIHIQPTS